VDLIRPGMTLVAGDAQGELLSAMVGLSFWGGVDPRLVSSLINTTRCAVKASAGGCSRFRADVDRAPEAACCSN
jgi:predicted aconitase with swiveling domain